MDSSGTLPVQKNKVNIRRGDADAGDNSVILLFTGLETEVALSDSAIEDIKKLFDKAFEYMASNRSLIEFEIDDAAENDLFNHVSRDIIDQLNAEIKESEEDFVKIWELVKP